MTGKRLTSTALALLATTSVVACGDTTLDPDERGPAIVELCRDQGGVVALEDELVVCRDQSFHEAPE